MVSAADPRPVPVASLLPSGTITFAFTDIEGSTQRWDRNRAAMQAALRRHDELMHAAIADHSGYVFKTIGDAFCAAFGRPEDAVAAMLDVQRALLAEDFAVLDGLPVRVAIHTGTADERDGDYFGPAVNRVARLLAIGHGGQVLVSGVTTDIVQGSLPAQATLRSLGEHRLRDLARPEQVYQLLAPGIASDFPPLRSLNELPNNLPQQLKSFVGRETEIAEITSLLDRHRLVTLVGSAGVGKTRTSLQVAANLLDGSPDGVWFIELAPLGQGDFIPSTIAQVLDLRLPPDGNSVANLARALKSKHLTLVLDNCEHLVEPVAHLVSTILRDCPQVRVLASSRQGLGIQGEETYRMPSLDIPHEDAAQDLSATAAIRSEAIALFVDRALAVDKRFRLTDENVPAVADICRRLDGIPLAIELAASRVKILSPRQLRERLDERFQVLTGGSRDVLPRQQTLRALIDWSHDLLDRRERALFRRLGIFRNGFTLEGAVAVASDEELNEVDVLDMLASLVDKSLVLAEPDQDSIRYRLLESTRIYALEKLSASGERDMVAGSHLRHLRDRFTDIRTRETRTARQVELYETLTSELDDVRAALDAALAGGDVLAGGALVAAIGRAWETIGLMGDGIARIEAYLAALPRDESLLLAMLSSTLTDLLRRTGRKDDARAAALEAVANARASDDGPALLDALNTYAWLNLGIGKPDLAEEALLEAEAIPGPLTSPRLALLKTRAFLSSEKHDFDSAKRIWEQLRAEHRALGNTREEAQAVLNNAEGSHHAGHTQQAITLVRELLPRVGTLADKALVANVLANLAGYLVQSGDLAGAIEAARRAIGLIASQAPDNSVVTYSIEDLALVDALRGNLARAAVLEGYADAMLRRLGNQREATERATYNQLTAVLGEGLRPDELARLTAEGAGLTPEAAMSLALED
jgi:predicted ATPase/class 3 adenylate cyclase